MFQVLYGSPYKQWCVLLIIKIVIKDYYYFMPMHGCHHRIGSQAIAPQHGMKGCFFMSVAQSGRSAISKESCLASFAFSYLM